MTQPTDTPQDPRAQHMVALGRANDIRLRQSALKRDIASGRLSLDVAFAGALHLDDDDQEALGRLPIFAVLTAARRVGPTRARKLCSYDLGGLPEAKRVDSLTARQRGQAVRAVRLRIPEACTGSAATDTATA